MVLTKEQNEVVEEVLRRARSELLDSKIKIVTLKVESIEDEEISILGNVKEFMEEITERTDTKGDMLGTTELWYKYEEWNEKRNERLYPEKSKVVRRGIKGLVSSNEMGRNLTLLEYKKGIGKVEGKTTRGYYYVKYKDTADTSIHVKDFMEKYTERTASLKDRIPISKLLPKFYDENRERYGVETFSKKLNKYGYYTKSAKEIENVIGKYGQVQRKKVGEAVPCVIKVTLKQEFYRNNQ